MIMFRDLGCVLKGTGYTTRALDENMVHQRGHHSGSCDITDVYNIIEIICSYPWIGTCRYNQYNIKEINGFCISLPSLQYLINPALFVPTAD